MKAMRIRFAAVGCAIVAMMSGCVTPQQVADIAVALTPTNAPAVATVPIAPAKPEASANTNALPFDLAKCQYKDCDKDVLAWPATRTFAIRGLTADKLAYDLEGPAWPAFGDDHNLAGCGVAAVEQADGSVRLRAFEYFRPSGFGTGKSLGLANLHSPESEWLNLRPGCRVWFFLAGGCRAAAKDRRNVQERSNLVEAQWGGK